MRIVYDHSATHDISNHFMLLMIISAHQNIKVYELYYIYVPEKTNNKDNREENDEYYSNRIFQQYEDKIKTFYKVFAIVIGFGVFFFFTAFWQYFSIQFEKANLLPAIQNVKSNISQVNQEIQSVSQQKGNVQKNIGQIKLEIVKLQDDINRLNFGVKNVQNNIKEINSEIDAINKAKHGVSALQQNITNGPQNLRDFLVSIQPETVEIVSNNCGNRPQSLILLRWINCNVNEKVNEYFTEYDQIIQQNIIEPLQALGNKSKLVVDFNTLQSELDNLHSVFNERYNANPEFYVTFTGKEGFFGSLNTEVQAVWNQHSPKIDTQETTLQDDLTTKDSEVKVLKGKLIGLKNDLNTKEDAVTELSARLIESDSRLDSLSNNLKPLIATNEYYSNQLSQLQNNETQLREEWNEIESPFGSIPIELKQLVALFPLSLAVGFLVCAVLIRDAIRLRRILHYSYQARNPDSSIISDLKIAYIAPLWIDPSNPEKNNLLQFVILSVPLIIFVISLIMILYTWSFPANASLAVVSEFEKLVYGGLYAISIGFFVYGCLLIKKELDCYSSRLPKNSKFTVNKVIEASIKSLIRDRKMSLEQADSLLRKLLNYKGFRDVGDFFKANQQIDEIIDEATEIEKTTQPTNELKVLIEEARKLRISEYHMA